MQIKQKHKSEMTIEKQAWTNPVMNKSVDLR